MPYSCTHVATVGVKGLKLQLFITDIGYPENGARQKNSYNG